MTRFLGFDDNDKGFTAPIPCCLPVVLPVAALAVEAGGFLLTVPQTTAALCTPAGLALAAASHPAAWALAAVLNPPVLAALLLQSPMLLAAAVLLRFAATGGAEFLRFAALTWAALSHPAAHDAAVWYTRQAYARPCFARLLQPAPARLYVPTARYAPAAAQALRQPAAYSWAVQYARQG